MQRILIGDLSKHKFQSVLVAGWVKNIRDIGKIVFIDVKDRSGLVQCVCSDKNKIKSLTLESVVQVEGEVLERPKETINPNIENGEIELSVSKLVILNKCSSLPIPVDGDGYEIKEEARLAYRYLDLRRDRLNKALKLRSRLSSEIRDIFLENDFIEVETPILTASTKEGARDFVVPSRMNPGKFYALPQSPQQYKQLLMTAGIERYFQFARCVRDENLRADRGFEFTQVDVEMSFVEKSDVMDFIENMIIRVVEILGGKILEKPFPRFTYKQALERFGADKFDLRNDEQKRDGILAFAWVDNFPFFKRVDEGDLSEVRDGRSGWTFTHNPFSAPIPEHLDWHIKGENIDQIITQQYDLVCNGFEVGGGSIRAHQPEVLRATFKIMGYDDDSIEKSVGHMLKAFELGTPPHGGIALGLDRLAALILNEKSIKEVIAFPMTYQGRISVMNGPSEISKEQLIELGISVNSEKNRSGEEIDKAIQEYLKSQNKKFEYIIHPELSTSEDHKKAGIIDITEGRKCLILSGKKTKKNYLFVIPSVKKLNRKLVKEAIGEEFDFEKPEVIQSKYGVEVGGVPPFGNLINLPVYYCKSADDKEFVNFSTGIKTASIRIKTKDFLDALGNVTIGVFSD